MLDAKFTQQLQNLLDAERAARHQQVKNSLSGTVNRLVARGMIGSGHAGLELEKVVADELSARGNLVLLTMSRIIAVLGTVVVDNLSALLKAEADKQLEIDNVQLRGLLLPSMRTLHREAFKAGEQRWTEDVAIVRAKLHAELDLYATALESRARAQGQPAQGTVHVTATTIGVVQTAPGSVAHVIQHIQPADQQKLVEALEKLLLDLHNASDVLPDAKRDIEIMAQETKQELANKKPILAKVRGMLSGIGETVQTLGSVRNAYELLKSAALSVGVQLP